jgi:hypothetical protein
MAWEQLQACRSMLQLPSAHRFAVYLAATWCCLCAVVLQGMAESRELEDFDGCRFSYCLISRRCRLHVGPRYKARGLNEAADPGNEIECDQVVWKHSTAAGKPLAWSRCAADAAVAYRTQDKRPVDSSGCC